VKPLRKILKDLELFSHKINLSKRFPFYINKAIFRVFFLSILFVGVADFTMNYQQSDTWYSYKIECPIGSSFCPNPFYNATLPTKLCKELLCDTELLYPGFSYGRDDILARHGHTLIFILFLGAFALNHINYMWRKSKNDI
jgi:hypothetical protein